jgi:hypothetical protein
VDAEDLSRFFLEFLDAFLDCELELVRDRRSFCRVVFDLNEIMYLLNCGIYSAQDNTLIAVVVHKKGLNSVLHSRGCNKKNFVIAS